MIKNFCKFSLGMLIMLFFYFLSYSIVKIFHLPLPPAILGLILFALSLIFGIIKEEWIEITANWLINNMAMFLIPFWGALILYQNLLSKNAFVILLVVFLTTTLIIVFTGLFVEYGIKFLRLWRMKKHD